ncbi:hypothetical protein ACUOCP_43555, partial [Escherichia sp. R-CC3]
YKKGKTPLSHRKWPGEPVPVITESIIQTLGDELLQKAEKKKNIVWRYENFSLEWQSASHGNSLSMLFPYSNRASISLISSLAVMASSTENCNIKKAKHHSVIANGRANRCLLSLKAS